MSNKKYTDQKIQDALEHLDFSYQEQDWDLMNARLDEESKKTRKFFWFRSIEAIVLLLAVVTLVEFVPFNQNNTNQLIPSINQPSTQPIDVNSDVAPSTSPSTPQLNNIENNSHIENNSKINKSAATPNLPAKPNRLITTSKVDKPIASHARSNETILSSPIENKFAPQYSNTIELETPFMTNNNVSLIPNVETTYANLAQKVTSSSLPQLTEYSIKSNPISVNVLDNAVPALSWNTNFDINGEKLPAQYIPGDPLPKLKKFRPWNLKLYFSPEMNAKANNNNIGLGAGGLITKEIGNGIHLGGGISYNNKSFAYAPGDLMPTSINQVQLMTINQHHLEIPIELEYTIKESVNWRPYVVAGVSSNFVLYTKYDYDVIGYVEKPSTLNYEYPTDTKGLLSGGNFKANNYYTSNIGLGLERQLDNNLYLFIQPTFRFALSGIGPKNEKINTISLVMGARTTL